MSQPTVMVSGCFDLLHSGHVEFLTRASEFGRLIVALGSDETIYHLKGCYPACREAERIFMVQALRCVDSVFISCGSGMLDFKDELEQLRPDSFIVNTDGDSPDKRALCENLGISYQVLERTPSHGIPARSSTELRQDCQIPYRIDLAGGWLDQPFVSKLAPGPVLVLNLQPKRDYATRSGLATSTRTTAKRLWGDRLPHGDPVELARILFACENPPGKVEIAGSQDALGLTLPGLHSLGYRGEYWPTHIEPCNDDSVPHWLEQHIFLRELPRRDENFRVLDDTKISRTGSEKLASAATRAWGAALQKNLQVFGNQFRASFEAQITMFPNMVTPTVTQGIEELPETVLGYKLAGAGGGGYLVIVAEECPSGFERIQVRLPTYN